MTIRAVFFDLGGVIVRTEYQAPRELLAERLNMTYEDLSRVVFESESAARPPSAPSPPTSIGPPSPDGWAAPPLRPPDLREGFFAGDVIDRGLLDFIRKLRPRYKTGVISNAWPDMREYMVENKFDDAFDAIVISAEVGVMKPELKIYRIALGQMGVRPGESVFVDDMPANVEGARQLGMQGILFRSPEQTLKN